VATGGAGRSVYY